MVTYDGSRRAAGTRVYIDGKPQPVDVHSDSLKDTMRTKVPLEDRPAAYDQPHQRRGVAGPADLRPQSLRRRGRATGLVDPPGVDPGEAGRPAEQGRERRAVGLLAPPRRQAVSGPGGPAGRDREGAIGDPRPRHRGPRDAGACRAAQGLRALPRRLRQAAGGSQAGDARVPSAHAGRLAAEPPRFRPMAAAAGASAHRPGDGQPLLAGGLRHRAW